MSRALEGQATRWRGYPAAPTGRGAIFCVAATARTISGGQSHLVPYPLHEPAQGLRVGQFTTWSSSTGINASSEDFEFVLLHASVMAVTSCKYRRQDSGTRLDYPSVRRAKPDARIRISGRGDTRHSRERDIQLLMVTERHLSVRIKCNLTEG